MKAHTNSPKIALVYDRLNTAYGGAEYVLQELHAEFPDAPIYTSVYHPRATWADDFTIKTSFLQRMPFLRTRHQIAAAGMPLAFESFSFDDIDIVISVSSAEAKGIITSPETLHISYLLTPPRYLDPHNTGYISSHWYGSLPGIRFITKLFLRYLSWWDTAAALRPDHILTISSLVTQRLQERYNRPTDAIIFPPIPVHSAKTLSQKSLYPEPYFLCISRLVPYKKIELVLDTAVRLQKPVIIVGHGTYAQHLISRHPDVTAVRKEEESLSVWLNTQKDTTNLCLFVGNCTEQEKQELLLHAHTGFMLGVEDFGITALEYLAFGCPVIYNPASGAHDILRHETATFALPEVTQKGVLQALLMRIKTVKKRTHFHNFTVHYTHGSFRKSFRAQVDSLWHAHKKRHKKGIHVTP